MPSFDPIYQPGLFYENAEDAALKLIYDFPESQRRKGLFDNFVGYLRVLCSTYKPVEVWLDGSFVTKKLNPGDIDLLVVLPIEDFMHCHNSGNKEKSFKNFGLDCYYWIDPNDPQINESQVISKAEVDGHIEYWKKQYGFDREMNPKGILVFDRIQISKLLLEGGGENVNASI